MALYNVLNNSEIELLRNQRFPIFHAVNSQNQYCRAKKIDEDDSTTKLSKIEKKELINDDRDIDELIEDLKQIRDSGNRYHISTTIFRKVKLPDRTK